MEFDMILTLNSKQLLRWKDYKSFKTKFTRSEMKK